MYVQQKYVFFAPLPQAKRAMSSLYLVSIWRGHFPTCELRNTCSVTDMDIDCPFCSFNVSDLLDILEHIEHYHPDDKQGSSDTNHIHGYLVPESYLEGGTRSHDTCSEVEYIQCECGEHVEVSEFTSHLALHVSEEFTSYSNLPQAEEYGPSSTRASSSTEFTTETGSQLRAPSSRRKTSKHADHSEQRKAPYSKRSLTGRCLGPSTSHTRQSIAKTRHTAPRRLGVG